MQTKTRRGKRAVGVSGAALCAVCAAALLGAVLSGCFNAVPLADSLAEREPAAPVLTASPESGAFWEHQSARLEAAAFSPDGGEIRYEWYSVDGADGIAAEREPLGRGSVFAPSTETTGTASYAVKVTNTGRAGEASVWSAPAVIAVSGAGDVTPMVELASPAARYTRGERALPLTARAAIPEGAGGFLLYKWQAYRADDPASLIALPDPAPDGTRRFADTRSGESFSYLPATDAAGTFYYRVQVTHYPRGDLLLAGGTALSAPVRITVQPE